MYHASDSFIAGASEVVEAIVQRRWLDLLRNARSHTRGCGLVMCVNAGACMRTGNVLAEIGERTGHGDRDARRECTTSRYVRQEITF